MKAVALFAAATALIVGAGGWVFTRFYPTAEGQRAVVVSALVAAVVQLVAFAVLRAKRSNAFAAWGLGAMLRLAVLAVYALFAVRALGLDGAPALLSLVAFFSLSTLVEPLLLNV